MKVIPLVVEGESVTREESGIDFAVEASQTISRCGKKNVERKRTKALECERTKRSTP